MEFWQHLLSRLLDEHNVYLITVIENIGSSPGRKGFKMLVSDDGFIFGSVGGGVMEFLLVEEAKKLLKKNELKIFLKQQVHQARNQNGSGMICSGEQTVVFHPMNYDDIFFVQDILKFLQSNSKGKLTLTPTEIKFTEGEILDRFELNISSSKDWFFSEQIGFVNTLYIVGGGHVSLAVSELFVALGFRVIVFDDRENLNTIELNNSAHQKIIVDFNDISNYISPGSTSYVAIMTNKYVDDKLVLSKLISNNYAYLGVLGSTAKLNILREALEQEGVTKKELSKFYGPIGISIKSQTPYEIAVSIAAEVIMIKNKNQ